MKSTRVFQVVSIVVILGAFSRSDIPTKVQINTSAGYLSRAVAEESTGREYLEKSLRIARRALRMQPDSIAASRLVLIAMVEGSASFTSLPFEVAGIEGDSLSVLHLGRILWDSGEAQKAIELWRSIDNVEYYFVGIGNKAYAEGYQDSAVRSYETSLAISDWPSRPKLQMYTNLCECEIGRRDYASAIVWCSSAVQVGRTVWTLLRLGRVHFEAGDYETALATFKEARDLRDDVENVHYNLCLTYRKLGQLDLALQSCERGLTLAPTHQYLNMVAGDLYGQMGQLDEAFCCYLRVIGDGSNETLVSQATQRVEESSGVIPIPTCDTR